MNELVVLLLEPLQWEELGEAIRIGLTVAVPIRICVVAMDIVPPGCSERQRGRGYGAGAPRLDGSHGNAKDHSRRVGACT
jgi:hypothetical protein